MKRKRRASGLTSFLFLGIGLSACSFPPSSPVPGRDRFGYVYPEICLADEGLDIRIGPTSEALIEQRAAQFPNYKPMRLGRRILAYYDQDQKLIWTNPRMQHTAWEMNDAIKHERCRAVALRNGVPWDTSGQEPIDRLNGGVRSGW
ncbi:MAG: hypothetical protein ACK4NA_03045 [Alphaproteobacteria bacterium]